MTHDKLVALLVMLLRFLIGLFFLFISASKKTFGVFISSLTYAKKKSSKLFIVYLRLLILKIQFQMFTVNHWFHRNPLKSTAVVSFDHRTSPSNTDAMQICQ
jgi:hypothetical protein